MYDKDIKALEERFGAETMKYRPSGNPRLINRVRKTCPFIMSWLSLSRSLYVDIACTVYEPAGYTYIYRLYSRRLVVMLPFGAIDKWMKVVLAAQFSDVKGMRIPGECNLTVLPPFNLVGHMVMRRKHKGLRVKNFGVVYDGGVCLIGKDLIGFRRRSALEFFYQENEKTS
ncbi:hypothetical protein BDZ91DRAFT_786893 [Kalaharituber pfeilii]|nr:hypothetical protein BDZ91DRAFT_786893 [Kalaharituber pfeilii]